MVTPSTIDPQFLLRFVVAGLIALLFSCGATNPARLNPPLDQYNVVWDTPSKNSSGSMPIGNGDIGLNVWVEQGALLFYIGKTDSWSENGRLLKLGRVRIKLSPNPFAEGLPFRQELKLRESEIEIIAGPRDSQVQLRIWVDANQPVIRVEAEGKREFDLQVALEIWRQKERELALARGAAAYLADGLGQDQPPVVYPDTVLEGQEDRVVWYHRNGKSIWPVTLKLQGLQGFMGKATDPLLHRTFGGAIRGAGLVNESATVLRSSKPGRRQALSIYPLTKQTATAQEWLQQLDRNIERVEKVPLDQLREKHCRWWDEFWGRSWIRVSGVPDARLVTRGYLLQRFINACGGRGAYPIKFNGSIFTVDVNPVEPPKGPATTTLELEEAAQRDRIARDPDFRRWGGAYWFQNTRLMYWPMPACGDFDLMTPMFQMYLDSLPLARERSRIYFGHSGAFLPETMYFWGAYINLWDFGYGWNRQGRPVSFVDSPWIRRHWEGGIELAAMMLDYYAYTQDQAFLKTRLMPLAGEILEFYDRHYERDARGKIHFEPAQSLETYQTAVNPLPDIAGLKFILGKLLSLPGEVTSEAERSRWRRLLQELPPLPIRQMDGQTLLAPADTYSDMRNVENPELYAIFPFRLYGAGKPDLEMARFTFQMRRFIKLDDGMTQDPIQAAFLGLAGTARDYTAHYFRNRDHNSRFPAFWAAGGDWVPNQCLGGTATMALQTMLLQAEDEKILLFPAWPKGWNVEFKLHAPHRTTVEGIYRNGTLERLNVTPESRAEDVVRMDPQ